MNPQEKMKVIVDYTPSYAENDIVKEGLIKCYEALFGERDKPLSIFLKNDSGEVFGGIYRHLKLGSKLGSGLVSRYFRCKVFRCLYAKNSLARALLAFFVREIEHISFASLAHILERDISILTQLTSRFELKIHNNSAAAKSVEDTRRWLQDAKQEG